MPHKDRRSTAKVHSQLKNAGLRARKNLGQNFLVDENVRDSIIEAAGLSKDDTVLEVGPGLGALTEKLAAGAARVIAVELDDGLALRLKNKLVRFANIEVINEDILKLDLGHILEGVSDYKVVANIPYYITSPILRHFMQAEMRPSLMVFMMQDEVARDIAARPGALGFLAVSMRLFGHPEIVCRAPATCFYPAPRVDSAVVKFNMLREPAIVVDDVDGFLELVHAGFAAPRKQLHNSLSLGLKLEPAKADLLLGEAGIDPQRRPGTLTLEEWVALYRVTGGGRC